MDEASLRFSNLMSIGAPQHHAGLTIFPLITADSSPYEDYLTLDEAIASGQFLITEISDSGSVPELKAVNRLKRPTLIIDGEELIGAKQNRVVNTTILVAAESELILPVSCTEAGRWRHVSKEFSLSRSMMPPSIRARKTRSVSASLTRDHRSRRSDQGRVWDSIAELSLAASVPSRTGAMQDVVKGRQNHLSAYQNVFVPVENQVGLIAVIGHEVVGMDFVSSPRAYKQMAERMIRAYAMDALLSSDASEKANGRQQVEAFLREIDACSPVSYPGVGLGQENRYDHPGLTGVSLEYDGHLLHAGLHRQLPDPPFERSYWARPGLFLAGFYPGAVKKTEAVNKLKALIEAGIRCVINLVEEEEQGWDGKPLRSYSALFYKLARDAGIEATAIRIPVRDADTPDRETMKAILDVIDRMLERRRPVYLHCWGGRGRTGTVVGCWLARHGIAVGEEALQRVNWLRRNEATADKPSPETDAQRAMVSGWSVGE